MLNSRTEIFKNYITHIPTCSYKKEPLPLFLTFDDGPNNYCTESVLKILSEAKAKATFFWIAKKAKNNPNLVNEILKEGHSFGNHSLNHQYRNFFKGENNILDWIRKSEDLLNSITGLSSIGFRSPAGVRTPPLHSALLKLNMPLIHWNVRFFDTTIPWTKKRAHKSLQNMLPGSIILLHDTHRNLQKKIFTQTLRSFIQEANEKQFTFSPLTCREINKK